MYDETGSHAPDVPMTSRSKEEAALARYPRWAQDVVAAFPLVLQAQATRDLPRALFQIATIGGPIDTRPGPVLWDVGGGTSLFPVLAAAGGFRTTVVDIFDENPAGKEILKSVFPRYGIRAIKADIIADSPEFDLGVDIFTCIDSIEHWHHSPKAILHRMVHSLRPGGLVFIGTPNCVNLRKRLTVPFGYGKWTAMTEWYEKPRFNSHVREPDVDDLRYIARDLELDHVDMKRAQWRRYERGERLPEGDVLERICELTKQSPKWILSGRDEDQPAPIPLPTPACPLPRVPSRSTRATRSLRL